MSFNYNKYIKKLEHQEKTNPGKKTKYEPPMRPRATHFDDKTKYNRARAKQEARSYDC